MSKQSPGLGFSPTDEKVRGEDKAKGNPSNQ